jgi:hypothetical protein
MKHLKTYEIVNKSKYKVGDYILHEKPFYGSLSIKDIEMDRRQKIIKIIEPRYYLVEVYRLDTLSKININLGCREDNIERELTSKETEDFKIELMAAKYNI